MLVNILLTLVIFLVIIFIHEFGHFLMAKWSGVRVNEFALGMGPAIFRRQKGETLYSIRVFPIGGFCSMEGEDAGSEDPHAFCNAVVWKRMAVVVAGAVMNLLLGFGLIVGITAASDVITSNTVASFSENASSQASGLQAGDEILEINGRSIWVENDIAYQLLMDTDGVVDMVVRRNGEKVELPEVAFAYQEDENGSHTLIVDFKVVGEPITIGNVLSYSIRKSASVARLVWISLLDLVTGNASLNDLAGPIGMTQVVGQAASVGVSSLLLLAAFITINVGIFNLLPIPALDGGRLLFLIVEAIRRKPIKPEYEGYVHMVGFALLILLMIVVVFHDIWRLVT